MVHAHCGVLVFQMWLSCFPNVVVQLTRLCLGLVLWPIKSKKEELSQSNQISSKIEWVLWPIMLQSPKFQLRWKTDRHNFLFISYLPSLQNCETTTGIIHLVLRNIPQWTKFPSFLQRKSNQRLANQTELWHAGPNPNRSESQLEIPQRCPSSSLPCNTLSYTTLRGLCLSSIASRMPMYFYISFPVILSPPKAGESNCPKIAPKEDDVAVWHKYDRERKFWRICAQDEGDGGSATLNTTSQPTSSSSTDNAVAATLKNRLV